MEEYVTTFEAIMKYIVLYVEDDIKWTIDNDN